MTATLIKLCNLTYGRPDDITESAVAGADIAAFELNAADVPEGGVFIAVPGTHTHGTRYVRQSAATAVLTDEGSLKILREAGEARPILVVDDVRVVMGHVAAEIYDHPSDSLTITGVTSTFGKTTTTYILEGALLATGCPTGIIGTTGTRINGCAVSSNLTIPGVPALQRLFHQMFSEGVTHVVMEISSHALSLGRVDGVSFDVGCLLNLSQDHLNFHKTLEEYFQAKAKLFDPAGPTHAPKTVVYIDDDWGVRTADIAASDPGVQVTTVHTQHRVTDRSPAAEVSAEWHATATTVATNGVQHAELTRNNTDTVGVEVPLPSIFNVANATVAWAVLDTVGHAKDAAKSGLAQVRVLGRMERIDRGQDFLAVVNYAHKSAAAAEVLATLCAQTEGRVLVVVGAGGDRDSARRPIMRAGVACGTDVVIIADDNPRSEVPSEIRAAVVAGVKEAVASGKASSDTVAEEIGDHGQAICRVVELAHNGDSIVVAGKGHETGQDIGGVIHPFNDREQLAEALTQRLEEAAD